MKIICFSDSHGVSGFIKRALDIHPECEVVFFLGDGLEDIEPFLRDTRRAFITVRGNCDRTSFVGSRAVLKTESITLEGVKICATHGDLYGAKYGSDGLLLLAEREGYDVVLFGHTHAPFESFRRIGERGVYLFNPGSIGLSYGNTPTYGLIDITDGGISFSHGTL